MGKTKVDRFDRVFSAATDSEIPFIEEAAFRSGVLWRCSCGWNNTEEDKTCGSCGRKKPRKEK